MRFPHSVIAILLLVAAQNVFAQTNVLESDPISARKLVVYDLFGGYIGVSANRQVGTFLTDCNCEFTSGGSSGFMAGATFERLTRSRFYFGATAGIEYRSIEARFREREGVVQRSASGQEYTVPVNFLNTADVSLLYATLNPFVKVKAFESLIFRLGPSLSYVASSSLRHQKELLDAEVTFPNGERATVRLADTDETSVVLQDGPIEDLSAFQIGIHGAVGLEFKFGTTFFVSPLLQFVQPLTSLGARGDGFGIRSMQFLVEGKWIL